MGLTSESIHAFIVGEVYRTKDGDLPELLPYGYLVGDTTNIKIILKGTSWAYFWFVFLNIKILLNMQNNLFVWFAGLLLSLPVTAK